MVMLLIAACSDGVRGPTSGPPPTLRPTATATQPADAGSTPGLPASVRAAIARAEESGYEAFRRPQASPLRFDPTAIAKLGFSLDAPAETRTRSPFRTGVGRKALRTDRVGFYLAPDSVSESRLPGYARRIEAELEEIAGKLGIDLSSAFPEGLTMTFISPRSEREDRGGGCPVRGAALPPVPPLPEVEAPLPAPRQVWVVADDETTAEQVIAVGAHELAHQVGWARFGHIGDRLLSEGLATWLAWDSWLRWHGGDSLDDAVRGFLSAGTYVPFARRDYRPEGVSEAECLARRDTLYTEYASFVGFLIDRYGVERFGELVKTIPGPDPTKVITITIGPGIPTPTAMPVPTPDPDYRPPMADYRAVYGLSFEQLQRDWLRLLTAG